MDNRKKSKKYYWIKLTNDFLTSEKVDFLVSQDGGNGFAYVVLYQCLCLKTVNNDGQLVTQIGEILIPYDIAKLKRDLKWFSLEQLQRAFELFSKLGLIYKNDEGIIAIADFDRLIGSETYGAIEKREQRKRLPQTIDKPIDNTIDNVYVDIRDKSIEIRDIDNREIDIRKKNNDKNRLNEIKANGFAGELFLKLVDCEYVSLYELDTEDYINLFNELLTKYEIKDIKIKLDYFIHSCAHYLPTGEKDKQDKPLFAYKVTDTINNRFIYLKNSLDRAWQENVEPYPGLDEYLEDQIDEAPSNNDDDSDDDLPF